MKFQIQAKVTKDSEWEFVYFDYSSNYGGESYKCFIYLTPYAEHSHVFNNIILANYAKELAEKTLTVSFDTVYAVRIIESKI